MAPPEKTPDARFSLANERTYLAWLRTCLAFIGGGAALEALTSDAFESPLRRWISVGLILVGVLLAGAATWRWHRIEQALRRDEPLPVPLVGWLVAGVVAATGILLAVLIVVS